MLWKLSFYLLIGNRGQAVRYNFVTKIEGCRRWRKVSPHGSAFGLAKLCWCLVCCKAFVGTNLRCKRWIIGILSFGLGKSVWLHITGWPHCCCATLRYSTRCLLNYTCIIQWSQIWLSREVRSGGMLCFRLSKIFFPCKCCCRVSWRTPVGSAFFFCM